MFYPDRYDENKDQIEIDSIPAPNWGRVEHFIKEEGIYFFGGRNRNSEINNTVHILKLGRKDNYWLEAKTTGKAPCHRYQHCMMYLSSKNLLIVHGGRTSQNIKNYTEKRFQSFSIPQDSKKLLSKSPTPSSINKLSNKSSFTLGDMFALKLDTFEWIKIITDDEEDLARTNHCFAKVSEDTVLIFGGNGYSSMY